MRTSEIKKNLSLWVKDEAFHTIAGHCGTLITRCEQQDVLLARAADALNARPYNNDMVLGAEISDFRAKSQQ